MKNCINCGYSLADEAMFCEECGTKQPAISTTAKCGNCGAELDANSKFCPECGTPVTSQTRHSGVQNPAPAVNTAPCSPVSQIDENTILVNIKGIPFKLKYVEGKNYGREDELLDFFIGETPVTQALWMTVMGDNPSKNNANLMFPVTNIDASTATAFTIKLRKLLGVKFELPSEKQWCYVYSGGKHSKGFKFAGSNNKNEVSWGYRKIHPVGELLPNELGVYDIIGSIFEVLNSGYEIIAYVNINNRVDINVEEWDPDIPEVYGMRLAINIPLEPLEGEQSPLKSILETYQAAMLQRRQSAIEDIERALQEEAKARNSDMTAKALSHIETRKNEIAVLENEEKTKIAERKPLISKIDELIKSEQAKRIEELTEQQKKLNEEVSALKKATQEAQDILSSKEKELKAAQTTISESQETISTSEAELEKFFHRFSVVLLKRVDYGLFNTNGEKFDKVLIEQTGCTKEQIRTWNKELRASGKVVIGENLSRPDARSWMQAINAASGTAEVDNPYDDEEEDEIQENLETTLSEAKNALDGAQKQVAELEKVIEETSARAKKAKSECTKKEKKLATVQKELESINFTFEKDFLIFNDAPEEKLFLPEIYDEESDVFAKLMNKAAELRANPEARKEVSVGDVLKGFVRYTPGDKVERMFDRVFQDDRLKDIDDAKNLIDAVSASLTKEGVEWKPYIVPYLSDSENSKLGITSPMNYTVVNDNTLVIVCDGEMPERVYTLPFTEYNKPDEDEEDKAWKVTPEIDNNSLFKIEIENAVVLGDVTRMSRGFFCSFSELHTIVLPNAIEEIKMNAFDEIKNLESIILPENLEVLYSFAFNECGIKYLKLPKATRKAYKDSADFCPDFIVGLVPHQAKLYESILLRCF